MPRNSSSGGGGRSSYRASQKQYLPKQERVKYEQTVKPTTPPLKSTETPSQSSNMTSVLLPAVASAVLTNAIAHSMKSEDKKDNNESSDQVVSPIQESNEETEKITYESLRKDSDVDSTMEETPCDSIENTQSSSSYYGSYCVVV